MLGSQIRKEKNHKRLWEHWVTINIKINMELHLILCIKKFK